MTLLLALIKLFRVKRSSPANIDLFKVNNKNSRKKNVFLASLLSILDTFHIVDFEQVNIWYLLSNIYLFKVNNVKCIASVFNFNPFSTNALILYLLKTWENLRYFNVFRGYRSGAFVENGLIIYYSGAFLLDLFLPKVTFYINSYMWCVARFGSICTIKKTWKTPIEEC